MKTVLAYIVVSRGRRTAEFASRFVGTWLTFDPGAPCDLIVVCNGGPLARELGTIFMPLNCTFFCRAYDDGWDVSAYQDVAKTFASNMQVCFGETVYFHREGWLRRLIMAWDQCGPGMYGCFGSHLVRAHLNTTAFACDPEQLRAYPKVISHEARYQFEHGSDALWRRVHNSGAPARLVTWDGVWKPGQWRQPANVLWRGDQQNCLVWCNHVDRYRAASDETKDTWAYGADSVFK